MNSLTGIKNEYIIEVDLQAQLQLWICTTGIKKKNLLSCNNVKILSMPFEWQKTVRKAYSWKKLIMENPVQHIAEHRG